MFSISNLKKSLFFNFQKTWAISKNLGKAAFVLQYLLTINPDTTQAVASIHRALLVRFYTINLRQALKIHHVLKKGRANVAIFNYIGLLILIIFHSLFVNANTSGVKTVTLNISWFKKTSHEKSQGAPGSKFPTCTQKHENVVYFLIDVISNSQRAIKLVI